MTIVLSTGSSHRRRVGTDRAAGAREDTAETSRREAGREDTQHALAVAAVDQLGRAGGHVGREARRETAEACR